MSSAWTTLAIVVAAVLGLVTGLCWSQRRLRLIRVLAFILPLSIVVSMIYVPTLTDNTAAIRLCWRSVSAYITASVAGFMLRMILIARSQDTEK